MPTRKKTTTAPVVPTTSEPESVTLALPGAAQQPEGQRTITGLCAPFSVIATNTDFGRPLKLLPGCLRPGDDLSKVKLCIDHDRQKPVGYMVSLDQRPDGAYATFHVPEGEAGNAALAAARDHLKDGLSVGMDIKRGKLAANGSAYEVAEAVLYEVSLCAIPAYTDARVTEVHLHAQPKGENTMDDTEEPTTTTTTAAPAAPDVTASLTTTSLAAAATPASQAGPLTAALTADMRPGAATTTPRPVTLSMAFSQIATMHTTGAGAAQITAALHDIIPSDDAGQGFLTPELVGQVWQPLKTDRWWITNACTVSPLNNMFGQGWGWDARPVISDYTGDKTEISSSPVSTKLFTYQAQRMATGNDLDRAYVDFGTGDIIEGVFQGYVADLANQLNAKAAAGIIADATPISLPGADIPQAVVRLAKEALSVGASIDYIAVSGDLFDGFLSITKDDLPWWVAGALNLGSLNTDGSINVQFDAALPASTIIGGDKRAHNWKESEAIRVQLVDLPRGGLDMALFSYYAQYTSAPEAMWKLSTDASQVSA